jgi:hypothetical protein
LPLKRFVTPFLTTICVGLGVVGCFGSGDDTNETPNPPGNLFVNPGFEDGAEPWYTIVDEAGFTVTGELAHGGANSAVQHMNDPTEASGQGKVYYLVQEIDPAELPEIVEGYYRVENWRRGTPLQYLQFVIIAFEPKNFDLTLAQNYQLRYVIAGVDEPPLDIGNAHYVFLSRDDPPVGEWTRFTANIRDDFQRLWDAVPEEFSRLRLLFEVRWDYKSSGSGAPRADVYWDDLYIGDGS